MIGSTEVIVIVGVVAILFGARAIPKFARSVGQAKHEFEKGIKEGEKDDEEEPGKLENSSKGPDESGKSSD